MNKKEYLDSLREYLSFELPERLVNKNINFYDHYFQEQMLAGKKAEEVCADLGDPQLIAKSCIDAETAGADGIPNSGDEIDYSDEIARERSGRDFGTHSSEPNAGRSFHENGQNADPPKTKTVSGKGGCLVFALIVFGILALLVAFFSTSFGSAVLAVMIGAALLSGIIKLFKRK